jgi:hypothetical protein
VSRSGKKGNGADSHTGTNGVSGGQKPDAPPDKIADLCDSCVRFIASKYKVEPDYTEDTLSLVDQYVREARDEIAVRPEALDVVQTTVGAYFGEVVRRRFGAHWKVESDDPTEWKLLLSRVYLSFNPIAIAREAILEGDAEGWSSHFKTDPSEKDVVMKKLAKLPPVPEEEYYLPTTRFDVLQMVHDALRTHMEKHGKGDVTFGPDDYD